MKIVYMTRLFCICSLLLLSHTAFAQSDKIDFSKPPGQPALTTSGKSNASLLKESSQAQDSSANDTNLAEKYKTEAPITNGTFRTVLPNTGTGIMQSQPQMMNATYNQSNLGNMKVNSSTYYDDNGKIRGSSTTIDLGKRK